MRKAKMTKQKRYLLAFLIHSILSFALFYLLWHVLEEPRKLLLASGMTLIQVLGTLLLYFWPKLKGK